jgi:tetratricopeptide (TPR) repeat protein
MPARASSELPTWLALLALLAALALHAPGLSGDFVYDDRLLVLRNPLIESFANLPRAFTHSYWEFYAGARTDLIGYWRPLTSAALMLGHALGGGEATGFHAISLLAHALASLAAWRLARRLLGPGSGALFAALLFALHPVQIESVAWISAVNDPLYGALGLWSLERFLAWRARGSRGLPWASALLFALALLAKELAAALLPCALALDAWHTRVAAQPQASARVAPDASAGRAAIARAWSPFALVLLAYLGARMLVFESVWAGFDRSTTQFGLSAVRSALLRVEIFGGAQALLVWPAPLALFRPIRPEPLWTSAELWIALGASLAWLALALLCLRRRAWTALAALSLTALPLAPLLLRVESLGQFPLSDRFLYVPVLGAALLACLAARRWLPRPAWPLALLALVALCGWLSAQRRPVWASERALFESAVRESPDSPYAWWGLGRVLLEEHGRAPEPDLLARARSAFERAGEAIEAARGPGARVIATTDDVLQANLGQAWCLLHEALTDEFRDFETPRQLFALIAERRPDSELPLIGLAAAEERLGQLDEADQHLRAALRLNPQQADAHHRLGRLAMRRGEWSSAQRSFEAELALLPSSGRARVWLARALFQGGWHEQAREVALELRTNRPLEPEPLLVLAAISAATGDRAQAERQVDEALQLDPRLAFAWLLRGKLCIERGERVEGIAAFRRACELDPYEPEAHYNLGVLLLEASSREQALPYLERAYEASAEDRLLRLLRGWFERESAPPANALPASTLAALGRADLGRGALDFARRWLERALALEPRDAGLHALLGTALERAGDLNAALPHLAQAAAATPDSFEPHFRLGMAQRALGLHAESALALERALALLPSAVPDAELRAAVQRDLEAALEEARAAQGPPRPELPEPAD